MSEFSEIRDEVMASLKKGPELFHYVVVPSPMAVKLVFGDELIPAGVSVLTYGGYVSLIHQRLVAKACKVFFHTSLLTKHHTVRQIGKTTSIISKVTAKAESNPDTTYYIVFGTHSEVASVTEKYKDTLLENIVIIALSNYNELLRTAKLKTNSCVYHDHSIAE